MILVTGGTGYIGSHTVVELLARGDEVLILDNLCNSSVSVLDRIERIAGRRPGFVEADVRDRAALDAVMTQHDIRAVIHFAGLKAVGESVAQPLRYYDTNVYGTLCLLHAMDGAGVNTLVFSSSATVYGDPHTVPIEESFPLKPTSPYGRSKQMVEEILRDQRMARPDWRVGILRYFNPVGAHASGLIGESPNGIPNNLMPFVAQVAMGQRERLSVFGGDYPTQDGTGVRDYIHVVDLAQGHLATLDALARQGGEITLNLGTGHGCSVLEMVHAFEVASGRAVPYDVVARRPGDVAAYYADPKQAHTVLGWQAKRDIAAMCADTWRWQCFHARPTSKPHPQS